MPQLIKKIEAEFINDISGNIIYETTIIGKIQQSDYINLNGFIAFLQDYSKTVEITVLKKPLSFGFSNDVNAPIISMQISIFNNL